MSLNRKTTWHSRLNERLATSGFRFTPQRQHVYNVLLQKQDHPTAEEVFLRAKKELPAISMATVYNCLDALVKCGLLRLVILDRGATRFCPNMREHFHFYCDDCGRVYDIDSPASAPKVVAQMPKGFKANYYELAIHGLCAECARQA
jgi:Fur family peroxide stress response transcriptional regulator